MSMLRPAVNQLISSNESIYFLTEGIAKRAREIVDEEAEAKKRGEDSPFPEENPVELAVKEFHNGKFKMYSGVDETAVEAAEDEISEKAE